MSMDQVRSGETTEDSDVGSPPTRRRSVKGAERPAQEESLLAPTAPAANRIDDWFGELRFHHCFNGVMIALMLALAATVPQFTLLPFYLALVARIPSLHLQQRHGFTRTGAALTIAAIAFLTLIATFLVLLLPVILQAATIDANALEGVRPAADRLTAWANTLLATLGVDPKELGLNGGLTTEALIKGIAGGFGEGAGVLMKGAGLLLKPFILTALTLLIVFMASYALASSESLKREARRFLRVCWPERTVAILERLTLHAQYFGAEVFRGYSWMVLVLGLFYFLVYLGAVIFFETAQKLPPLTVVALLTLSAVIGAVPGLGAKILLLIGALAGLLIGVVATLYTGDVWLGVYIFVAVTVVTGFESKFGTPSTMGRALGINSCLMLFLAISTIAGFGVAPTLWAIFVILPILVAGMRVMTELHGDQEETDRPIPQLQRRG